MCNFKTLAAVGLLAIAFSGLSTAANAADAGRSAQGPQIYSNAGVPQSANMYTAGVGSMVNNSSMNMAPGAVSSVNLSGVTGNLNVQTNIDNSRSIDSSSNISVNTTINGSNIGYGLDGANVLNVIDAATSADATVKANIAANADAANASAGINTDAAIANGLLAAELEN
jgi:hypothetical protein